MNAGYSVSYKILDQGVIHQGGPIGLIILIKKLIFLNSFVQSGKINHYSVTIILGTILFIFLRKQEKC